MDAAFLLRGFISCLMLGTFALVSGVSRTSAFRMILIYLIFMGIIRRYLNVFAGHTPQDPLVLIVPIYAIAVGGGLLLKRHAKMDTRLVRFICALLGLMVAEMFNPLQGSILVGLAGAIFYIVPLLWYVIGKVYGSPDMMKSIVRLIMFISLFVAAYGLKQVYLGFSDVENRWLETTSFHLGVLGEKGEKQRPFSFLSSPAEYTQFIASGMILFFAVFLRGKRFAIIPVIYLGSALLLSAQRSIVVWTFIACMVLWGVQGITLRSWVPRLVAAMVFGILGFYWSLNQLRAVQFSEESSGYIEHQISGLTNPLGEKSSGRFHAQLFLQGIYQGFSNPLGYGLGITNQSSSLRGKDVELEVGGTEIDISNMFVSLGVIGGLIYLIILYLIIRKTLMCWHKTRSILPLSLAGILIVGGGQLLNGNHYSTSMFAWLLVGILDRVSKDDRLLTPRFWRRAVSAPTPATVPIGAG